MNKPAPKCKFRDIQEIFQFADTVRSRHVSELSLDSLPIEIDTIAEKEGFFIVPIVDLPFEREVFAHITTDSKSIFVRQADYYRERHLHRYYQTRFGIAHEMGHGLLHAYALTELSQAYDQERSLDAFIHFNQSITDKDYANFERQANWFAGRLLVPRELLLESLQRCLSKLSKEQQQIIFEAERLDEATEMLPSLLTEPAKLFEVNGSCIRTRILQEELWTYLKTRNIEE